MKSWKSLSAIESKLFQKKYVIASWIATMVLAFLLSLIVPFTISAAKEVKLIEQIMGRTELIYADAIAQLLSNCVPETNKSVIRLPRGLTATGDEGVQFERLLFNNVSNEFLIIKSNNQYYIRRKP